MAFFGFDPSGSAVGWAILSPKNGEYALAAYGSFSPTKLALKSPLERLEIAYRETKKLLSYFDLNKEETKIAVEYAAINTFGGRSMEVILSICVAVKCAAWELGYEVVDCYPRSWQALIKIEGLNSKDTSRELATSIYSAENATEDACDAVAIAHWCSIMKGERYLLDSSGGVIHKLEDGLSDSELTTLGRGRAENAKKAMYRGEVTKEKSQNLVFELRSYEERLKIYRKKKGKQMSKTSIKIDGQMPGASSRNNKEFEKIFDLFSKIGAKK